jgi:hypothetical protein
METIRCFYDVSVSPVAPGVLEIVQKDELLNRINQIEVALPGNVIGLDDRHLFVQYQSPRTL